MIHSTQLFIQLMGGHFAEMWVIESNTGRLRSDLPYTVMTTNRA